jgi:hypothetical protein
MKKVTAGQARQYVKKLALPSLPKGGYKEIEAAKFDYNAVKNQAMVVGSDIVSFVKGVTPEWREDIANSALLAQLAAKKAVSSASNIEDWYNAYFDVLVNIGWVLQDRGFTKYSEESQNFQAHEAILQIATSLLAPNPAALAVVKATLDALKSMSANSPWMTIFNRESQSANTARFQVTLVEQGSADQLLVSLMAFGLEAKDTLTQVLFFKYQTSEVTLKHYSGKVTINPGVLSSVREQIKDKIVKYADAYVRGLPDLG